MNKLFPALTAGCGAIDIAGIAGAPTLLPKAVWGLLEAPAIAVRPMMHSGKRANKTPLRTTDAVSSWAWQGATGKAEIEVYSCDDHVELMLNGKSLGRKSAGKEANYVSRFSVAYEPGELEAVCYRNGIESGRSSLRSASQPRLQIRAETEKLSGPNDLLYLAVELADKYGVIESMANDQLAISVSGAAELVGFGCAAPYNTENFTGDKCTTYLGRAQAILRGKAMQGEVRVAVTSHQYGEAELVLSV